MKHFIVPVDDSAESWRAADVAVELARRCQGRIELVEVVFDPADVRPAESRLATRLGEREPVNVECTSTVQIAVGDVAETVSQMVADRPLATVVMASRGQGRSTALLGSVAEDLLRIVEGPIVIVGPQASASDFSGPIIVTVDGSDTSEAAIPIAAAWALELGADARMVNVVQPGKKPTVDEGKEPYPASLAHLFTTLAGRPADAQVLEERDVESAVADHAASIGASLIVTSTHGHAGTSRFVLGSTAAGFVRHAPCPVLAIQPKHFTASKRMPAD